MPPTDSVPFTHLGRSILSLRRDQVHYMDNTQESTAHDLELDSFQSRVSDRFAELSAASPDEILSLDWVRKMLDMYLACSEEFMVILGNNRLQVQRAPTDRLVADFFERSVKALDICNAIRDGIEHIRQWQKLLDIVLCALDNKRNIGEGHFLRAKKALIDLAIAMIDEKDSGGSITHRNRSFGRNNGSSKGHHRLGHFRSLSWSVSRSWSAAKQLQGIGNNLNPPRGNEIAATGGLSVPIYTMGSVLLFVMWVLVAAIPCQDRGLHIHFNLPRQQYGWTGRMMLLHERILEESKKRERKNTCGLLREIYQIEKWARIMNELGDSIQFPLSEDKLGEVRQRVQELADVCKAMKAGLDPLERQVREVFHKIVRSRTEGLDSMGTTNHP